MTTITLVGVDQEFVVTDSINQVRAGLNRASDPEQPQPFHEVSFTLENGERLVFNPSVFSHATGPISRRADGTEETTEDEPQLATA